MPSYRDKILILIFCSLLFLAPIVAPTIHASGPIAPDLYKAFFLQVGMLLLLAFWFAVNVRHDEITFQFSSWHLSVFLLLAWSCLSLLWAFHLNLANISLFRWLLFGLVLFIAIQLIDNDWKVQVVLFALWLSCVFVTIVGISQFLDIPPLNKLFPQAASPAATFGNRNMAMHFVLLTLPLSVWFFISSKRSWQIFLSALGGGLMIAYIFYSGNRTTMIGLFVQIILGLIAFLYVRHQKTITKLSKDHILSLLIVAIFVVLLINFTSGGWRWVGGYVGDRYLDISNYSAGLHQTTFKVRLYLWYNSLYMLLDNLFLGVGIGNWTVYFPYYTGNYILLDTMATNNPASTILYKQAHNEYVQIAAELGIIGCVLIGWCFLMFGRAATSLIRLNSQHSLLWCWIAILIGAAGVSVSAMGSFPFRVSIPLMTLAAYLGILWFYYQSLILQSAKTNGVKRWLLGDGHVSIRMPSVAAWGIVLTCLVGAYLLSITYSRWIEAHILRNRAGAQLIARNVDKSFELIKKSLALNPADPDDGYYILGNIYRQKKLHSQAIATYEHALQTSLPYHPYMFTQLHFAYLFSGDNKGAERTLQRAIREMPKQDGYYAYLGSFYGRTGDVEQAIRYYKEALELNPRHPRAQQMRSIIAHHEKQKKVSK